jgi:hypothetical protein
VVGRRHGEVGNFEGIGIGTGRKCQLIVIFEKEKCLESFMTYLSICFKGAFAEVRLRSRGSEGWNLGGEIAKFIGFRGRRLSGDFGDKE